MSAMGKKKRTRLLMNRSKDEIKKVEDFISLGYFDTAISRSYYSVFYAATAVMAERGMEFSKHKALISAFGKEFGQKDEIGKKMHGLFIVLFDERQEVDYKLLEFPKQKDAEERLMGIKEFHEWARSQLRTLDDEER